MKKLLAIVLAITVLCSFTACGNLASIREELMGYTQAEYSKGTMEGKKYESKFIGIGIELPESWTFYTDEQIQKLHDTTADMAGAELQEILKKENVLYDMVASDGNTSDNINVILEKADARALAALDLDAHYEEQISVVRNNLRDMGLPYGSTQGKVEKITVDGKELSCIKMKIYLGGKTLYQVAFSEKCNDYLATITLTTSEEDTMERLLETFYWLK